MSILGVAFLVLMALAVVTPLVV